MRLISGNFSFDIITRKEIFAPLDLSIYPFLSDIKFYFANIHIYMSVDKF